MSTRALELEFQRWLLTPAMNEDLDERQAARADRVARELARRDYRFRPHGRVCCCEQCCDLLDYWTWMGRRGGWTVRQLDV